MIPAPDADVECQKSPKHAHSVSAPSFLDVRKMRLMLEVRRLAAAAIPFRAPRTRRRDVLSQAPLRHGPWRILGAWPAVCPAPARATT